MYIFRFALNLKNSMRYEVPSFLDFFEKCLLFIFLIVHITKESLIIRQKISESLAWKIHLRFQ